MATASIFMSATPESLWLHRPKQNPRARLRMFCFPYAGGAAPIFRAWPEWLPPTVEVCPVQLPGRGARIAERPRTSVEAIVRELTPALLPCLDLPFVFFGHSMGAILAFEMTRRLWREYGMRPEHLFVSGRRAPQLAAPGPPTYGLPEPLFRAELRRLNGTPREALEHPELMELMLPILRADFSVTQTYAYAPGPPLDCPITAFGGLQDGEVPRESIAAWREQTAAAFVLRMLPGDHFFLNTARQLLLPSIARELTQTI
ncbi:MAG TPA: alpha/beta fold hydrolase [Pyrinomonadaceae bacterium]